MASQCQGSKKRRWRLEARSLECSPHYGAWTSILKKKEDGIGRGGGGLEGGGEKRRGREKWVGECDSGRYSPNVPIPDSPMPNGPSLLKLNLGTCLLETGSLGLGKPPFLVSLLPSPTPDPPSYIPSSAPATAALPTPGAHPLCSVCSLVPSTHLYSSPLSLLTLVFPTPISVSRGSPGRLGSNSSFQSTPPPPPPQHRRPGEGHVGRG